MNVVVSVGDDGTWIKECGEGGKDTMSGMTDREKAVDWSENHLRGVRLVVRHGRAAS